MGGIYVGSAAALAGTSYGIMLLSKAILTSCIPAFGWVNLKTVRATSTGAEPSLLLLRRSAEAEAGLGVTVILAAASLTSIPPAIDVQADRVRAGEIHDQMMPRMQTPRFAELSPATPLVGMQLVSGVSVPGLGERKDTPADIAWSEYNQHWAGLVMLAVGFLSMLARRWRWARAWPLVFLGLALFLLIRARL
jgi:copper resistance protein D